MFRSARSDPRVRSGLVCIVVLAASVVALAGPPRYAPDRPWDMEHICLQLAVDFPGESVGGTASLRMTALVPARSIRLDAVELAVRDVKLACGTDRPQVARYANDGRHLEIECGEEIPRGQSVTVTVDYGVERPRAGLHFFAPPADDPNAGYQLWSQGEAEDNRFWIPCFDHPGERQTSEIIVRVDATYQVLSNGRRLPAATAPPAGQAVHHWIQDRPHAPYLISLVVGRFHVVETYWRDIPVSFWVPLDKVECVQPTFGRTVEMLNFFTERIGIPYPWDQYAQVCVREWPGGMENTSATMLLEEALIPPGTPPEENSDVLIAHELAHQWWGDLLTCRDWPHLWLNEGFATYFEALWKEHVEGAAAFAFALHEMAGGAMAADARPVIDREYDDPGQLFDGRAYQKGAWILHMLRCRLGDAVFWQVLHEYGTRFAGQTVETVDLRRIAEQISGRSLERFFRDWTERSGHPVVRVTTAWNASDRTVELRIEQTSSENTKSADGRPPELFEFTLPIELAPAGSQSPVRVAPVISERQTRLVVPLIERPAMVRVDPDSSVLMLLTEEKPRDLWLAQLVQDPNPIGRLRAVTALATKPPPRPVEMPTMIGERAAERVAPAVVAALAEALRQERFWGVQCELARVLGEIGDPVAEDALRATAEQPDPRVHRAGQDGLDRLAKARPN